MLNLFVLLLVFGLIVGLCFYLIYKLAPEPLKNTYNTILVVIVVIVLIVFLLGIAGHGPFLLGSWK